VLIRFWEACMKPMAWVSCTKLASSACATGDPNSASVTAVMAQAHLQGIHSHSDSLLYETAPFGGELTPSRVKSMLAPLNSDTGR